MRRLNPQEVLYMVVLKPQLPEANLGALLSLPHQHKKYQSQLYFHQHLETFVKEILESQMQVPALLMIKYGIMWPGSLATNEF